MAQAPKPEPEPVPTSQMAPPSPKKGRARPRRLILVVVLLVAVVGGGLFVSGRLGSSKSTSASVASASPPYVAPQRQLPARRAVALPAALTASPGSGDVITPAAATAVVQATWDLRHGAVAPLDVPMLAAFEAGPALDIDAARCACADPYGPASRIVVSVPHQTSFPARFFAQVATTASNQPWIAFLVFTRADSGSPWMLQLMGGYAAQPTDVTAPAVDAGGFLTPQAAQPNVDPATVHALLTQYWRFSKDNGKVPPAPLWQPGPWTTEFAAALTRDHQGAVAQNGLIGFYAYQAAANGSGYAFPEPQGSEIVCSAIYMQNTYRPTAGQRITQDAAKRRWGKSVPPGAYREVTQNEIAVPCIEVPATGSHQKVRVLGGQAYPDVTTYK